MIRINLLSVREDRKKEGARQSISIGILSLVLLVLVLGYIQINASRRINTLNSEIKSTEEEINRLNKVVGDVEEYKKRKKELQEKIKVIDMLSRKKTGPVHMLDELSKSTPGKLWITSLQEIDLKLTLSGIALDNETIASFMRNMERSTYFSDIELIQSQQEIQEGLRLKRFDIACRVLLPENK
ncbi:MAG: PilN domain-containing protein [Desulfobacterales bacterium]|nr:PilN domain-containing protein [Desulfobacterales bacterium]